MGTRLAIQLIVAVCISFLSVLGSAVFLQDFYLKPLGNKKPSHTT